MLRVTEGEVATPFRDVEGESMAGNEVPLLLLSLAAQEAVGAQMLQKSRAGGASSPGVVSVMGEAFTLIRRLHDLHLPMSTVSGSSLLLAGTETEAETPLTDGLPPSVPDIERARLSGRLPGGAGCQVSLWELAICSIITRFSHGRATIHLSSQLHPHPPLSGSQSMKVRERWSLDSFAQRCRSRAQHF